MLPPPPPKRSTNNGDSGILPPPPKKKDVSDGIEPQTDGSSLSGTGQSLSPEYNSDLANQGYQWGGEPTTTVGVVSPTIGNQAETQQAVNPSTAKEIENVVYPEYSGTPKTDSPTYVWGDRELTRDQFTANISDEKTMQDILQGKQDFQIHNDPKLQEYLAKAKDKYDSDLNYMQWKEKELGIPIAVSQAENAFVKRASEVVSGALKSISIGGREVDKIWDGEKPIEDYTMFKLGKKVDEIIDIGFPELPEYKDDVLTNVAGMAGTITGLAAGGAVTRSYSLPAGISEKIAANTITAGLIPTEISSGAMIFGGTTVAAPEYEAALEATGDPDKAFKVWMANMAIGATETVPINNFLKRLNGVSGGKFANILAEGFKGSAESATQEVFQQLASNLTAQQTYDLTRELTEGLAESAMYGGLMGGVFSGAAVALQSKVDQLPPSPEKEQLQAVVQTYEEKAQEASTKDVTDINDYANTPQVQELLKQKSEVDADLQKPNPPEVKATLEQQSTQIDAQLKEAQAQGLKENIETEAAHKVADKKQIEVEQLDTALQNETLSEASKQALIGKKEALTQEVEQIRSQIPERTVVETETINTSDGTASETIGVAATNEPAGDTEAARQVKEVSAEIAPTEPTVKENVTVEPITFKTGRGSAYQLIKGENGYQTIRDKVVDAAHPDGGIQDKSERTIFIDPKDIGAATELSAQGHISSEEVDAGDKLIITRTFENGRKKVIEIPYHTEPTVGDHPLELWSDAKHLGSKITEINSPNATLEPESKLTEPVNVVSDTESNTNNVQTTEVTETEVIPPAKESDVPEGMRRRKLAERIKDSTEISQDLKDSLKPDAEFYVPKSLNATDAEVKALVDFYGLEAATESALDPQSKMTGDTRSRLMQYGIKELDKQAAKTEDPIEKNRLQDKANKIADAYTKFGTEAGQTVNSFKGWSINSGRGIVRQYEKTIEKAKQKAEEKLEPVVKKVRKAVDSGNKKAAEKAVDSFMKKKGIKVDTVFGLTKTQAQKIQKDALSDFRKAMTTTNSGVNPEALKAMVKYGYGLAAEGIIDFKQWARRMRSDLGVDFKDEDLLTAWKDNADGKSIEDRINDNIKVKDIVINHLKNGKVDGLSDKIQSEIGIEKTIADAIETEIGKEFTVAQKQELDVEAKKSGKRESIQEAIRSGSARPEEIINSLKKEFKIPEVSPEVVAELMEMDAKRQQLPEGKIQDEQTIKMLDLIASKTKIPKADLIMSIWYASILSGPGTHMVNVAGNLVNSTMEGGIDAMEQLAKGDPTYLLRLAPYLFQQTNKAFSESKAVWTKGLDSSRSAAMNQMPNPLEQVKFKGGKANPFNYYKYVGRGLSAVDAFFYSMATDSRSFLEANRIAREEGLKGQKLVDRTNEILYNNKEIAEEAGIQARTELELASEKTGIKFTENDIKRRKFEILEQKRLDRVSNAAKTFAQQVTYNYTPQGVLGMFAKVFQYAGDNFKPFKAIIPFTRIVANVLNQQLDYTPYGYARAFDKSLSGIFFPEDFQIGSTGAKTVEERNRKLIKASIGLSTMAGLYAMAAYYDGLEDDDPRKNYFDIIGRGPSDPNKKGQLMTQGVKFNSLKIGDKYINFQYTPLGLILGLTGNYRDAVKYKELDKKAIDQRLAYAAMNIPGAILDMSFLSSLSDMLSSLGRETSPETAQNIATGMIARNATSFVPAMFKQIDKWFDPTIYDATDFQSAILKEIPFVDDQSGLKPKLNILGQPISKQGRFTSPQNTEPVWRFLAKKEIFISAAGRTTTLNGQVMTPEQYYEYVEKSGKRSYDQIESIISELESMPKSEAKKLIDKLVKKNRKKVKAEMAGVQPESEEQEESSDNGYSDAYYKALEKVSK